MSSRFVSILLIHLALCTSSGISEEVTVRLDNGDVLSGVLVGVDPDGLTLKVDYLGEIVLPGGRILDFDDYSAVDAGEEVDESVKALAENVSAEPTPRVEDSSDEVDEEPATVAALPQSGGEMDEAESQWYEAYTEWLSAFSPWDKRLQLGMNSTSGRKDQSNFNYRFDMQLKRETDQMVFNAEYFYGKANGTLTKDTFKSKFRWRKDIAPGVFYESNSIYSSDTIKKIDSNVEQKLGLGTRFVESDASTLSAGLGGSGRWRQFNGDGEEVVYLVDVFQDWDYRFSERIRLRQDFRVAMPLEESEDYEFNFSAAVTSDITNSINLSLRYELGYDNSLDEELREDRRFVSSLGYAF